MPSHARLWIFASLCLAGALVPLVYVWATASPAPAIKPTALAPIASSPLTIAHGAEPSFPPAAPLEGAAPRHHAEANLSHAQRVGPTIILVRHTGLDQSYGALAAASVTGEADERRASTLNCEVLHFAGGRGVCLEAQRGVITTYAARLFDADLRPTASVPLDGIPSRTRVSPDGRRAAFTVFVSGHSYTSADFSTRTSIVDAVTGEPIVADLEQMEVWSQGSRLQAADFNFWGVTFERDSNRFYATLATGGVAWLVEGDIAANRVTMLAPGVECPSLSPDNTHIAFKKRVDAPGLPKWRLYVMDVATLRDQPVAERRFIDEQVEWLDNRRILYTQVDDQATPSVTDIWLVPSDGTGEPFIFLKQAASPAVVLRRPI